MQKYNISKFDILLCKIFRTLKGSKKCPEYIFKLSRKKYGWSNDLARYYIEKYEQVPIGAYTYGMEYLARDLVKSIGKFCSISSDVYLVRNAHKTEWVSSHPALFLKECGFVEKDCSEKVSEQVEHSIEIGNDVWLGSNCIIFNGVKIGDGAVIAAGAIVRKDVPPYAVVVGIDRIIKYRFSEEIINILLRIKWWDWDEAKLKRNIDCLYDPRELLKKYETRKC